MVARKLELRRRYDETAELYDERYAEIQSEKYGQVAIRLRKVEKILDLGCGTGMFLSELVEHGRLVVGVDVSPKMLKIAKKRAVGANLILADADHLPFTNGCFDAVVSITLLQNMPDPSATTKEIARITKSGGMVILTTLKRKHALKELRGWMRNAGLRPLETLEMRGEDVLCVAERV